MAATLTKTNERPGVRAQVRFARMSATKARAVLDLVRGLPVDQAAEVLQFTERAAATVIDKLLSSAIANAEHNDQLDGDTLYISACYADEGPTLKRWRPRARGRATRIRKRTCHITIIVSPMPDEMLSRVEAARSAQEARGGGPARRGRAAQEARRARVARSRAAQTDVEPDEGLEDEELEFEDEEFELEDVQDVLETDRDVPETADEPEDTVESEDDEADTEDEQTDDEVADEPEEPKP
jgi:large subunit ribosomal protein L22